MTELAAPRPPGLSVRLKLTLSYAAFVVVAGGVLLVAGYFSLSRGVHPGVLFVVQSHADLWRNFAPIAAEVMTFLVVFGLVGGWFLAGRMLAPLTRITDATRLAAAGSLTHRIALPGSNDELRELADAFDAMLARLEAHVGEQQRFAANASHELRTPLAITQTLLEVASKDPNLDTAQLLTRLRSVNDRAVDLTDALLVLSRAEQAAVGRDVIDLSLVAEEATETLTPLADNAGVTIHTCGTAAPTLGSRALLQQVATNLVHNAIVHNTAEHGCVWIRTDTADGRATLSVENTGEPLAADVVATLSEPFQRGSERTHDGHAGVGLGLAIVKRVVETHGGSLALAPREDGGLQVTVRLPAHGDP